LQQKHETVLARPHARSTTKIRFKNRLCLHRHFTEHLVGVFGKPLQKSNLNHEPRCKGCFPAQAVATRSFCLFNLIYKASDKNNSRLNYRLMLAFRKFLDNLNLSELHLHGRLYTWSNEQIHPTLSRINRSFSCLGWCNHFPYYQIRTISSSCSDHCPLLLHTCINVAVHRRSRFESVWPHFLGYMDAVAEGWWYTL
jgi:hypothetical protein